MKHLNETSKLYVVRVFNNKGVPDRFYDQHFFNEYEQNMFYKKITGYGFEAVKREEDK